MELQMLYSALEHTQHFFSHSELKSDFICFIYMLFDGPLFQGQLGNNGLQRLGIYFLICL